MVPKLLPGKKLLQKLDLLVHILSLSIADFHLRHEKIVQGHVKVTPASVCGYVCYCPFTDLSIIPILAHTQEAC